MSQKRNTIVFIMLLSIALCVFLPIPYKLTILLTPLIVGVLLIILDFKNRSK